MKFSQKLILVLSFGYVILSSFAPTDDNSTLNSSSNSVQSIVTLNGGAQNRSAENISSAPPTLDVKVSKNSSSSVSNSKRNPSTSQPGNKIRYFPNENPGGSGSGDNGFETGEWETKSSCPEPDGIISNVDFWNSYLESKDLCPNIDVEFDEDDDWSFKDIVKIPDEVLSLRRRILLETQPTAKIDIPVQSKYTYSNSAIAPFSFYSKEGKILTIKNKPLEKIVYAHSDDLNLLNFADRVVCPIQPDPSKFQRSECRAVTNSGKNEALLRILELTTTVSPDVVTRKFPMPSYTSQDALAYIDLDTRACLFFHTDTGNLWSAKKLSRQELQVILSNPNFENLN